jgi:hypothetical protein
MSKFREELADSVAKAAAVAKTVTRAPGTLPASTTGNLFRVTGAIKLLAIIGEVTTVIQTQANATKLQAVDDVTSTATDLCATLDITAKAVGSLFNITGTVANAMVVTAGGVAIAQAGNLIIPKGVIRLNCVATNTGAVKWSIRYEALEKGASVVAV